MGLLAEIGSSVLLYFLVFGMSATVDIRQLRKQLRNRNALLTGITLQFIVLPFLGFVVVKLLQLPAPMGITLLVITSSPGGSYSNWWCSLFNADLALSVTMTTISTLLSIVMLPVNLVLYATTTYSNDVVKSLDWTALFISLVVVIGGIFTGLLCSATIDSHRFNLIANKVGNVAGLALVTFSIVVSSSDHKAALWQQPPVFYIGVALPCLLGLLVATWMAAYFRLAKPERVAVAVECCYQNTGIATSVAAAMFEGEELAVAVGVPLFYGICEAVFLAIYCTTCWKLGWTKAPADENLCTVIFTSYEVKELMEAEPESIEVVLGGVADGPSDLIFARTKEGYQIDEVSLESLTNVEDGEFTIDDDDDGDQEAKVELDVEGDSGRGDLHHRTRRAYETVDLSSPVHDKKIAASPQVGRLAPLGSGVRNETESAVTGAISSLSSLARGGKKYTKASAVGHHDVDDVPAAGKQLD
ncbi:Sodium Bile acid symporter family [Fragilaria crotonensis]|nr:Sodium Bile acid symporter family [Fragilaria crotonensis]